MKPATFLQKFGELAHGSTTVSTLRELVLRLAVTGRLTEPRKRCEPWEASTRSPLEREAAPNGKSADSLVPDGMAGLTLPATWGWAPFREVAFIRSNLVSPRDHGEMPHVAPDNIEKRTGRLLSYRSIQQDGVVSSKHRFYAGQILYSKIRPNLSKAVVVDFDGLCSADMYPIEAKLNTEYLHRFILSPVFLEQVTKDDNRLAMPKVNQQQLSEVLVVVPPLPEQKRIVEKVDHLMALCDELEAKQKEKRSASVVLNKACLHAVVASTEKKSFEESWKRVQEHFEVLYDIPENVAELRQAILQLAVMGKLVRQDPKDEPAEKLLAEVAVEQQRAVSMGNFKVGKAIEHANGPSVLPQRWLLAKLESLLVFGPRNGLSLKGVDRETNVRVLTLSATTSGRFLDGCFKFVEADIPHESHLWLMPGDFLIQRGNTLDYVGIAAVYSGQPRFYIYPDLMMKFRASTHLNARYVHLALNSAPSREFFKGHASGTSSSMPKIDQSTVRSVPIPVPPRPEQDRIVAKVDQLMAICDDLEARLKKSEQDGERLMSAMVEELVT